ncbi:MAG: hypothetical protein M3Q92_06190 [Actinomycetota bacterium]|nr:hypothetical protein [Actinomycetota bacterium]
MLDAEAQRFARFLFAAYPVATLREQTEEIYVRFLAELKAEAVAAAVADLVRSSTVLPTVADIRRRIAEAELALPTAHEAFHSLFESGERHPLTRYVAEIFGGEYNIKTSELPTATRSQFVKIFDELRDEAIRRGDLPRAVVAATERRAPAPEPIEASEPGIWGAIRGRFDALPDEERKQRLRAAQKRLLKGGEVSAAWLGRPVIEHEALRQFGGENGWLDHDIGSREGALVRPQRA